MTVRAPFMASNQDTAEDVRLALSTFMAAGAAVLDRRSGVVPFPGACTISTVSPMVGRISPFVAWVDGTSGSNQGGYPVVVDAAVDNQHDAGEPGNTRVDRYVLQIEDNPYDASTFQRGRVRIVKGTPGGAPNPVPASSILLYDTTVPANASIGGGGFNIFDASVPRFPYTAAAGGLLRVRDQAERDALVPFEGDRIYRLDALDTQIYRGGQWVWDAPPLSAYKPADESVQNNTLQDDDHLFVTLAPNATYKVELLLNYTTPDAQDIVVGWSVPAGAIMRWAPGGLVSTATSSANDIQMAMRTGVLTIVLGGGGGGDISAVITGNVTTSSAGGQLRLRWAQNVTAAVNSTVKLGSMLTAQRVGS